MIFVSHDLNLAAELRRTGCSSCRTAAWSGSGRHGEVLDAAVLEQAYGCPVWVERLAPGRPVVLGVRL